MNIIKILKVNNVRLYFINICSIVVKIENEIADMLWLPLSILDAFESKEVVVYGIYIILIYALGFSLTINVALLCSIYIMWTNKQ